MRNWQSFWRHVRKTDGCWLWTASTNRKGYGQVAKVVYGTSLAHRAAWEFSFGKVPDGSCVLHRCDVPACVNPSHLFLGTTADNNADMRNKRRQARGERHGITRLTAEQVEAIRSAEGLHREIAARFGVHQTTVTRIRNGNVWAQEA